jgi:nucleotide-binding universal stress UspA family protein
MNGLRLHSENDLDADVALRPSTIVVPIDGAALASRALIIGHRWAATFGADLVVASVDGELARGDLAHMQFDAFEVRAAPRPDLLVATVSDIVTERSDAAIVVATRARSPLVDALRADVAQQLLRSVEVPVVLVGPHWRTEALDGPVVVAHDGTTAGSSVLDPARALAASLGSPSVLLHVHQPMFGSGPEVLAILRAAQARLGSEATLEIVTSSFPAGAIREFVHEVDASLLALSMRGRTDMLTASTGRTATWVVRESPCPVLVAHPRARHAH